MMDITSAERFYTVDTKIASCARFCYSYDKDAAMPIAFAHYAHKRSSEGLQRFHRKNAFTTLFIFLREGFGFIFGDTLYTPERGEMILAGENIPFTVTFDDKKPLDYYEIDYYEINLPSGFERFLHPENPFCSLLKNEHSPLISLPAEQKRSLISLLYEMERTERDPVLYARLVLLADLVGKERSAESATKKIPQVLARAMQYISERYTEIGGAEDVAAYLCVSTTYLARLFGRVLGCTTTDYICRLRIGHAKAMLLDGHSVTETCYACGFNSYTYFTTKFKKETGLSPAKFRTNTV